MLYVVKNLKPKRSAVMTKKTDEKQSDDDVFSHLTDLTTLSINMATTSYVLAMSNAYLNGIWFIKYTLSQALDAKKEYDKAVDLYANLYKLPPVVTPVPTISLFG